LSFFDEGDEPTRVRQRPARPRRPATASRTPGAPPDRQTARMRQGVAIAGLVVLALVLIFGIKGCLDSRKENALKDYNRNVTAVINDSDTAVGQQFFKLMANGARQASDLGVQVNQLRLNADQDAKRARGFSVPGDMKAAQRNLELVLDLRDGALQKIADQIPNALGRGQTSTGAIAKIAGQMQVFLASDVVYKNRVAPLIKEALDKNGIHGQDIADSQFMPDIAWLSPDTISARLGRGTGTGGTSNAIAPGLHGHGLLSTSVGTNTLAPGGVVNHVAASPNLAFTIKFANQGDSNESDVKVSIAVKDAGKTISQTKTIGQTTSKQPSTVSIPLGQAPAVGAGTVTVAIARVPGETNVTNNRATYTVIFQR
jgi:hypothetical protein